MAKIRLTKNELKKQKDNLKRFTRYLPTLELKKKQLLLEIRKIQTEVERLQAENQRIENEMGAWVSVFSDDFNIKDLIVITEIRRGHGNIAGIEIPIFEDLIFEDVAYDYFDTPFWVDRGFTPLEIGVVPGTLGVIFTIIGALLGGSLTRRWGIFHALWILGLAQAGSNLFYAGAAALPPSAALMYTAAAVESFCGGLGTAPFLAFLMSICNRRYAATQYALMTALFGLARSISGAFSGYGAALLGYDVYFLGSFFMAFPAYCLLPRVRQWLDH